MCSISTTHRSRVNDVNLTSDAPLIISSHRCGKSMSAHSFDNALLDVRDLSFSPLHFPPRTKKAVARRSTSTCDKMGLPFEAMVVAWNFPFPFPFPYYSFLSSSSFFFNFFCFYLYLFLWDWVYPLSGGGQGGGDLAFMVDRFYAMYKNVEPFDIIAVCVWLLMKVELLKQWLTQNRINRLH